MKLNCFFSGVLLLLYQGLFAQEVENPGWGFIDFESEKEYIVDELSGSAIQAAIEEAHSNGGGTVWIEAGIIEITEDINLRSNVKLKGRLNEDSILAVTIRATKALYQALIVARNDVVQNTTVENLIIDGGGFDHHGISYIYGTDNFLVSNCKIFNIGYEKVPCHPEAGRSGNPTAINMWSEGDDFTDHFTIRGNHISSVALHGININNGRNFILQDNYVEKAFMGWDASNGSKTGEILGNEVVDCIFGAKTHSGVDLIIHHNNHHHLDDTAFYYDGEWWDISSGTAFVLQGPGISGVVVKNNIFSGTTAEKGISSWNNGIAGATLENNDTSPSGPVTGVKTSGQPAQTFLEQNHPNPFDQITRITYTLPGAEQVVINLFKMIHTFSNHLKY